MISGIVPFEEIVQSIKDETGIENMRPFYERIKRLIFRAEREIGYGGSVVLMKKVYPISASIDASINKYFKFPEDLIELEGVGQECHKIHSKKYTVTSEGVRFKDKQVKPIVVLYWGIKTDDSGYPMVTRNHEEAVVSYIVWKLYSQRIFLGIGNMNMNQDFKQSFVMALLEARGDDAFPTLEEWNALGELSYTDRRLLIDAPVNSYSYCEDYDNVDTGITPILDGNKTILFWQAEQSEVLSDIIDLVQESFFPEQQQASLTDFMKGYDVTYLAIGRAVFCVVNTEDVFYSFRNSVGSRIDNAFDSHYFEDLKLKIYVSKNVLIPSTVEFNIEPS